MGGLHNNTMEKVLVRLTVRLFFMAVAALFASSPMAVTAAPAVPRPAPAAPSLPVKPTAPPITVLIIALDEVGAAPAEPKVAEPKVAEPKAAAPIEPAAPIVPAAPALAPAAIIPARPTAPEMTRAYAKSRPKNEDDLFKMEPLVREAVPVKTPTLPALPPPPAIIPMTPDAVPGAPGGVTTMPLLDAPPARPPSPAMSAAALLRRALAANGFTDVLSTSLDGVTLMRAITARRLTERVVDQLQSAMGQVIAAPATAPATPPGGEPEVQPGAGVQPDAPKIATPKIADPMQSAIQA
ncbi:MAG TPA: hypothetical protein VNA16_05525, partial [Abditibacteriaceae bacterium]|nr:hypothetical protein [Abditibacteriaceae bacterium]